MVPLFDGGPLFRCSHTWTKAEAQRNRCDAILYSASAKASNSFVQLDFDADSGLRLPAGRTALKQIHKQHRGTGAIDDIKAFWAAQHSRDACGWIIMDVCVLSTHARGPLEILRAALCVRLPAKWHWCEHTIASCFPDSIRMKLRQPDSYVSHTLTLRLLLHTNTKTGAF